MSHQEVLPCKSCHHQIDATNQTCPDCHSDEPFDMLFCKFNDCGKSYPKGLSHCLHCGRSNAKKFAGLLIFLVVLGLAFMVYSLITFMNN